MESIQRSDLEQVLARHSGNHVFRQALGQMSGSGKLLRLLSRYIQFNSIFGSGVANLASEIAARRDLFRDPDESIAAFADRSVEVAASIFSAAIDEFGDRETDCQTTHRSLAQATLKAAGAFFDCDAALLDRVTFPNAATLTAIERVREGYLMIRTVNERDIFRGIGFHLGSELLADSEFRLLDDFLKASYPELVGYLSNTKVAINGARPNAYLWIRIHTSVEADHFENALAGANRTFRYYAGSESRARIKGWILDGFAHFAAVQTDFMQGLIEE